MYASQGVERINSECLCAVCGLMIIWWLCEVTIHTVVKYWHERIARSYIVL
jgi:hypothetical protein